MKYLKKYQWVIWLILVSYVGYHYYNVVFGAKKPDDKGGNNNSSADNNNVQDFVETKKTPVEKDEAPDFVFDVSPEPEKKDEFKFEQIMDHVAPRDEIIKKDIPDTKVDAEFKTDINSKVITKGDPKPTPIVKTKPKYTTKAKPAVIKKSILESIVGSKKTKPEAVMTSSKITPSVTGDVNAKITPYLTSSKKSMLEQPYVDVESTMKAGFVFSKQ